MKHFSFFINAFLGALASLYALDSSAPSSRCLISLIAFVALLIIFELGLKNSERGIGWRGTIFTSMVLMSCALAWQGLSKSAITLPASIFLDVLGFDASLVDVASAFLLTSVVVCVVAVCLYEFFFPTQSFARERAKGATENDIKRLTYSRRVREATIVTLFVIVVVVSCVPQARAEMAKLAAYASGDFYGLTEYIRSYGAFAVVASFILMILQSLAAPIPAFLITFANAAIYGWAIGALISWSSAMVASAICFFIARFLGRDAVMNFMSQGMLESIDKFFEKYGKNAVLICRLLPFVSFDFVSYAAGLTGMDFLGFFVATGIGQLPATIVYSYLGDMLTEGVVYAMYAILSATALFFAILLARKVFRNRHEDLDV